MEWSRWNGPKGGGLGGEHIGSRAEGGGGGFGEWGAGGGMGWRGQVLEWRLRGWGCSSLTNAKSFYVVPVELLSHCILPTVAHCS